MRGPSYGRLLGIALIAAGSILVALPLLFVGYAWLGQARLQAAAPEWQQTFRRPSRTVAITPAVQSEPAAGAVAAELRIARLGLNLAVLQGTGNAILAVAPGHEPQSVMPGSLGTAVIVAHNLTFFRNIDLLRRGDPLTVRTAAGTFPFRVTGHSILPADASLPNTPQASLALIACYPLNALYLTPQRYVVFASLTHPTSSAAPLLHAAAPSPMFQATLPRALQTVPLWLSDTNLTVSSANLTGGSSIRITGSGGSWSLVAESIRMFAGTMRALADGGAAPLAGFGPHPMLMGLAPPGPWAIRPDAAITITTALRSDGSPATVTVALPYATLASGGETWSGTYSVTLGVVQRRLYLLSARWTS